jgi:DNA uptake protein ComE-like DNA-binding protein
MNAFVKFTLLWAWLVFALTACQAPAEQEQADSASAPEASTEQPEAAEPAAVLNANLATEQDLSGLGLSPDMVKTLMDARPFLTMQDLDALLGEALDKATLYQRLFVPFNLNTTPEEDFKMIPGVGDRMAHEFEEYRPYLSIQQFRREIGKYVDEAEVARYEQYVFVPVELNRASEADIKALPGVGNRMAHEFEEYRPYTSLAQFEREIGKYVDDKELARLKRLVYLAE